MESDHAFGSKGTIRDSATRELSPLERRMLILQAVSKKGVCRVGELCALLKPHGVERGSITYHLKVLDGLGMLRFYDRHVRSIRLFKCGGFGARLYCDDPEEQKQRHDHRRAMAEMALSELTSKTPIVFGPGTALYYLAQALATNGTAATVLTNSLPVAAELAGVESVTLYLLGGRYDKSDASVQDPRGLAHLPIEHAGVTALGVSGLDYDGVITCDNRDELDILKEFIRLSPILLLVAEESKIGLKAAVEFGSIPELTGKHRVVLVTTTMETNKRKRLEQLVLS